MGAIRSNDSKRYRMHYTIKPGDTITDVTARLGTDFATLKKSNPAAVGRSKKTGDWIVKAGATVNSPSVFADVLAEETAQRQQGKGLTTTPSAAQPPANSKPTSLKHVLKKGETIWGLATQKYQVDPQAILKANAGIDPKNLQIGQEIVIPGRTGENNAPGSKEVVASWYGRHHHGRTMANGQPFNMHDLTLAHRDMPLGTRVELENPDTGQKAEAVVTDRGPYVRGRDVDLSYRLAKQLSMTRQGVANLKMRVL